MSAEKEKRLEASAIVLPALKRGLESFDGTVAFRESKDDSPVNFQEKEDFRTLTSLAITAQKLHCYPQEWRQKIDQRRAVLKSEIVDIGDVITAIEIDEVYCDFLMAIGETDQAVELARHITDGYVVPDPMSKADQGLLAVMGARMQEQQFGHKKEHILVDLAYKFIKRGDLAKAVELVEGVDLTNEGYLYFAGMLDYHKENRNISAIEEFIADMDRRVTISQEDKEDYRESWRMLRALSNQAKEAIAGIQAQSGNLDGAMANMEAINVGNHRVREQTEFVEKLLKEGKEAEARQLAESIIDNVNANTSLLADKKFGGDDEEEELDETIGSLDFLKPKQTESESTEDEDEYEFRNYDRAEVFSSLAKVLAPYPQYRDLFDLCVNGPDGSRSIADSIALANKDSQSSLWSNLIEVYGRVGDRDRLEETYRRGCELYPDSVDFLTMEYAYALYDFDQEKALELILSNPDLERRADGFASFVRAQIEEKGFKGWQDLIAQLVTLEDAVLLPQQEQETEFSIDDLNSVEDDDDEDPDKQVVTSASSGGFSMFVSSEWPPKSKFWRKSPGLLANLAKLAITKGEWDTFGKIFQDERMSPTLKTHVLSEVTDWLQEGKEIKFWF